MTKGIIKDMPVLFFGKRGSECTVIHKIHKKSHWVSDEINGVLSITSKKRNNLFNRIALNKLSAQRAGKGW